MQKYNIVKPLRISEEQDSTLKKLKDYKVNVSQFIRDAIKEKLKRDWKKIKEKKSDCPF